MYEEILKNRTKYEYRIEQKSNALERAKIDNARLMQLNSKLAEVKHLYDALDSYNSTLAIVDTAVTTEAKDYQTRRIDYLNDIITEAIQRIFPKKKYRAKLQCSFSRTDHVELTLIDENGYVSTPYICEGKLLQYLISVSAVSGITKGLGYSGLFVDEAFGVSNADHYDDIGKLLQSFVDDGLQIVLISQNQGLFAGLKRHAIYLETEYSSDTGDFDKAVVREEKDI